MTRDQPGQRQHAISIERGGLGYITYDLAMRNLRNDPRYSGLLRKMKPAAN